jgi:hypothetical protein
LSGEVWRQVQLYAPWLFSGSFLLGLGGFVRAWLVAKKGKRAAVKKLLEVLAKEGLTEDEQGNNEEVSRPPKYKDVGSQTDPFNSSSFLKARRTGEDDTCSLLF